MATTSQQLTFAIRAVNEASKVLSDVKKDLTGVGLAAEAAGKQATADTALGGIKGHLSDLGGQLKGLLVPLATFGGALGGVFAVKGIVSKTSEIGTEVAKLKREFGGTAEDASKLRFVLEETGVGFDKGELGLAKFSKALAGISDMEDGVAIPTGKAMVANLKALGIEAEDASGKQRPMLDIVADLSEKFKGMGPGAEATALATTLFGKAGRDLLPMLLQGKDGIKGFAEEADHLGLVLDDKALAAMKKQKLAAREMQAAFDGIQLQIGLALVPVLTLFAVGLTGLAVLINQRVVPAITFVIDHFDIFGPILAGVAVAITTVLVPSIWLWVAAETAKVAVLIASAAAFIAANAPLIAIGLAIALLVAGILLLITHWDEITKKFPILGTIADAVVVAFKAIATFVTGTLVPALQSVVSFISAHWPEIKTVIETVLNGVKLFIETHIAAVKLIFETAWPIIKTIVETAVKAIKTVFETVFPVIKTIVETTIAAIKTVFETVFPIIKGIVETGWATIKTVFETVIGVAGTIVGLVKAGIEEVKRIVGTIIDIVETVTGVFTDVVGAITGAIGDATTAAGNLGLAIVAAVMGPINSIKEGVQGVINGVISIIQSVINKANEAIGLLNSIPGVSIATKVAGGVFGLFKAEGGPVAAGSPYIVGERGPELFVPGASGSIIPNNRLASGGGSTIVINIHAWDSRDVERAIPKLARSLEQHQRRTFGAAI